MEKMTLDDFRARYSGKRWTDEDLAEAILESLPARLPLVRVSRDFLEAWRDFCSALAVARIERD